MVDQTNKYERNFEQQGQLKRPGRIDLRIFQYLANAGDGYPGLQYSFHKLLGNNILPRFVVEGCVYDGTKITSGYIMYDGKIRVVKETTISLSNGEYLYIDQNGLVLKTSVKATAIVEVLIAYRDTSSVLHDVIFKYEDSNINVFSGKFRENVVIGENITIGKDADIAGDVTVTGDADIGGNIIVGGTVDGIDISAFINQNVKTTARPTFAGLDLTDSLNMGSKAITNVGNVDGVDVSALKADVDGFPNGLKNLEETEITQLCNIGAHSISSAEWGYLANLNQNLYTTYKPTFNGLYLNSNLDMNGNQITDVGNVDGVDVSAFKADYDSKINQNVKTSASPTFNQVNTDEIYGANGVDIDGNDQTIILRTEGEIKLYPNNAASIGQLILRGLDSYNIAMYCYYASEGSEYGYLGNDNSKNAPLEFIMARRIYDDDGDLGSYSHVDDLQLLREVKPWKVRKKIPNKEFPKFEQEVFDVNTLPWVKTHPNVDKLANDDNHKRYSSTHGQKIGYLLSTLKKLLDRQDRLISELNDLGLRVSF